MDQDAFLALADKFFAAIESGDSDTVAACYADDNEVWLNTTGVAIGKAENLKVLAWIGRNIDGLRYTDIRRIVHDGGIVQQHVLRGTAKHTGIELEVPAMLRLDMAERDGELKIVHIDEYLDSAQVAALMQR